MPLTCFIVFQWCVTSPSLPHTLKITRLKVEVKNNGQLFSSFPKAALSPPITIHTTGQPHHSKLHLRQANSHPSLPNSRSALRRFHGIPNT